MGILDIRGLYKRFGDKEVLRGVDLTVGENSIFGFVGKNGAGKTTLMKTVLGLIERDAGEITVAGERVEYGQTPTNRHIGYLPDVPEFYSFMTAAEYMHFCAELSAIEKNEAKRRVDELLDLVGLSSEKHRIKGYSRGMKQRLGIAQALLSEPNLLICDEPTSALDPIGRKEILDLLLSVKERTTVLFSTHILSDVERIATDIAFLDEGKIKISGNLALIKQKYRRDEYVIEVEKHEDTKLLMAKFSKMRELSFESVCFFEGECDLYEVLSYISFSRIPVVKIEKKEPTLESLFLEVVDR